MGKVSKGTIVRTAVLILALINQLLSVLNIDVLPITNEQVQEVITMGMTLAASVWAWWKNNSFTEAAIKADEMLGNEKNQKG